MRDAILVAVAILCGAGCASAGADRSGAGPPSAPPIAAERTRAAGAETEAFVPDPHSPSRVLGWVEGEVITYREVLQIIGPELAQIEDPAEKSLREERALFDLARERLLHRAAVDAGVRAEREEVDAERAEFVKDLAKNGATLEAFLHEHEMSRREFDEMLRKRLVVGKYRMAAIGRRFDPGVRVRPVTDTYVAPEDVRKYYDRNPDRYHEPAGARCRLLAVRSDLEAPDREKAVAAARARAEAARARLAAGEDWVPVFRQENRGAPEPDPLDGLVEMRRGEKAKWIEDFAFGWVKGSLSEVEQHGTTFYVLRGEGAREERAVPFDEAAPGIRAMLAEVRARMAWLEVELSVLDESSVQPEPLRSRLRDMLRRSRQQLLTDAGL